MTNSVERFRARRAKYGPRTTPAPTAPPFPDPAPTDPDTLLASVTLTLDDPRPLVRTDADTLLAEIRHDLTEVHFAALIDSCKRECLQAVIRPFGAARVLFDDKLGGNVTTTHNFEQGITATDADARRHDDWQNRDTMSSRDRRKPYLKDYAPKKKKDFDAASDIVDGYTGAVLEKNPTRVHWEHVVPVSEIDRDAGRNLRMTTDERVALANADANKVYTTDSINLSKNDTDLKVWYDSLSDAQKQAMGVDEDLVREQYSRARQHVAREDAKAWARKDGRELLHTGLGEGARMGTQQAFGALMEEFVLATFDEVEDAWKNGFRSTVDESFLHALKDRLMRVVARVHAKWRDALTAFRDGTISGFLSNLVTYIINMFFTTSARLVRVVREGFFSLLRALKMLVFPPEGMTLAEAADAALKVFAAGCVTGAVILLEEWIAKNLLFLGPLADYAAAIVSALVTGLGTAFVTYALERLDLFGVQAKARHHAVMEKLDAMITLSVDQILQDGTIFDEPALLHTPLPAPP